MKTNQHNFADSFFYSVIIPTISAIDILITFEIMNAFLDSASSGSAPCPS